jgi:AraC family transcriptional regulator
MEVVPLLEEQEISVSHCCCSATRNDPVLTEVHRDFSFAYVRRGSFGCRTRGKIYELVPGSLFVGSRGRVHLHA